LIWDLQLLHHEGTKDTKVTKATSIHAYCWLFIVGFAVAFVW